MRKNKIKKGTKKKPSPDQFTWKKKPPLREKFQWYCYLIFNLI